MGSSAAPRDLGRAWCYLDGARASQGPFPEDYLRALAASGYFGNPDTLFWTEGQDGWKPLRELPGLQAALRQAPAPAPAPAPPAARDPSLDGFMREVAAAEAEAAAEAAAPPASPPDGEREFVDDDGTRYRWDAAARRFAPAGAPAAAYGEAEQVFEPDDAAPPAPPRRRGDSSDSSEGEGEPAAGEAGGGGGGAYVGPPPLGAKPAVGAKRRAAALEAARERSAKAKEAAAAADGARAARQHANAHTTSVYVTGLPDDATEAELAAVFAKCGVIREDDDRRPRVKLYRDAATGAPKGDGLVTFLKEPSVELALALLDGAPLRPGGAPPMAVSRAKFQPKPGGAGGKPGGARLPPSAADVRQKKKRLAGQERAALGWGGFDDVLPAHRTTVAVRGLFAPAELAAAPPRARAALERELAAAAAPAGAVDRLRLFPGHPEGVGTLRFRTAEAAEAAARLLDGRALRGRQLRAAMWDGVENFAAAAAAESEAEQRARLDAYAAELEAGGAG